MSVCIIILKLEEKTKINQELDNMDRLRLSYFFVIYFLLNLTGNRSVLHIITILAVSERSENISWAFRK